MGGGKFQMILRALQTWTVLMLAFFVSGCIRNETATDKVFSRPDREPAMHIGRCAVVPEFDDQILVEVFVVNNGGTPVALDLNRFYLDLMDMSPQGYLWPLWGWYDSLEESCTIRFPPNSTNRFVLLTSYIGVDAPSREYKEFEERRWRERKAGGEYDIRLYYMPPTEATCDYLWTMKKPKHERQNSVLVGVVNTPLPARRGSASPSWDEWRTSRTNVSFRVHEK
jgi:hypothetical protein